MILETPHPFCNQQGRHFRRMPPASAVVYDVEFYKGGMEYEYSIDALDGTVLDVDVERED